ncbi:hypothetical protein RvVAR0630_19980 [Agrobacterium vitis]|nr:hypothetical protein RvVAR0630_19980 [Agrobacterium vitis]
MPARAQVFENTEFVENPGDVWRQLQAGADLKQLRAFLKNPARNALSGKAKGSDETGYAAADNCHGFRGHGDNPIAGASLSAAQAALT